MKQAAKWILASLSIGLLLGVVFDEPGSAQPDFRAQARKIYSLGKKNGKCQLCHDVKNDDDASKKNLNVFGESVHDHEDFEPLEGKKEEHDFTKKELELLTKILKSLNDKDADEDGATNYEEMKLGTFPGDKKSVPNKLELAQFREEEKERKKKEAEEKGEKEKEGKSEGEGKKEDGESNKKKKRKRRRN